jgi:hypothetical protein
VQLWGSVAAFATFTMAARETQLARMKSAFVAEYLSAIKRPKLHDNSRP